jgi:hypothetical protein
MRIAINAHIIIHYPLPQVFAWLTDISKWPNWVGNVVSMEQISAGSLRVGTQIRQVAKGGSKPSESIVEVTEFVLGQRFGIMAPNLEGAFTLEPIEVGTRLDARFEVVATGLMGLLYKLILKRFVMDDLRKFRKLVEATEIAAV